MLKNKIIKLSIILFLITCILLTGINICTPLVNTYASTSTNWSWPTSIHSIQSDWPNYSSGKYHGGTDFPVALNSPVYSTCDGEVVAVTSLTTSYGKHIKIKATVNGSVVYMRYCHLNSFAVSVGQTVASGQLIGYSGSTGNSTGPHLHYEVRNANDYYGNSGSPNLNPRDYLPGTSYSFESHNSNIITDGTLVNLGDSFSARITNCSSGKLLTNARGNVALYSRGNDMLAEQIWNFRRNADGSYKIISSLSDDAIDLDCANDADGANIKLYSNYNTAAQNWFIYQRNDGSLYFRSVLSNSRVFDLQSGSTEEGTNLQLFTYNNSEAQKYYINKCASIVNLGDELKGLIINTECWRPIMQTEDGNVVLGEENAENMPKVLWHMYRNPDKGFYTIYSYYNGKVLDVNNAEDSNGANVKCYAYHDSYAQRWYIVRREDGSLGIKAACASGILDLQGGSQSVGTNIQIWEGNGTSAQKFSIYQITSNDKISYNLRSESASIDSGESTKITIANALYAIDYKLHIVSPDGKLKTVELGHNNTYDFSENEKGIYKIYASVKSPVSNYTGSETEKYITIAVGYDYEKNDDLSTVYNGHLYQLIEKQNINWAQAKYYCEDNNSYLATITSAKENEKVAELVANYGKAAFLGGLRKNANEFRWIVASGDEFSYSNWTEGEPNNTNHGYCQLKDPFGEYGRENYIQMYVDGKWNDTPIFGGVKSFIMESEPVSIDVNGPTKTVYVEGENLDSNSIQVDVTFADGTVKTVDDYTISGFDSRKNGEQQVKVSYYGLEKTFFVTVKHNYNSQITKQPTCETTGIRTYTCTECGDEYTEVIEATGHKFKDTVVNPTADESGYTLHECLNCEYKYKSDYTNPIGHNYEMIEENPANCTADGYQKYKCTDCEDGYTVVLPALGHNYKTTIVNPTCTEKGYTLHTCTKCGDSYKDTYINEKGHHYIGSITYNAICTSDGLMTYKCTDCDEKKTSIIPATGHNYEITVVSPTCSKEGYTLHKCKSCGSSYKDTYTEMLNHNYISTITKQATCVETGIREYKCALCSDTYTMTIPKIDHNYISSVIKYPTCDTSGLTEYTCDICGDSYSINTSMLGHQYKEILISPTFMDRGYTLHRCDICGDYFMDNFIEKLKSPEENESGNVTDKEPETETTVKGKTEDESKISNKTVKQKQSMTVKAKTKKVKVKKLKKKKQIVTKAIVIKNAKGTVTYKRVAKGSSKKLTIDKKTGKITIKKGTKKGTYIIKVKVTAKGNEKYLSSTKIVKVKIKVK